MASAGVPPAAEAVSRERRSREYVCEIHALLQSCSRTTSSSRALRAAFEQRLIRIPIKREIREDLHAIQRTVTQPGQIT